MPALGLDLPLAITADVTFAGIQVDLQAVELDPGASNNLSFTPGLELVVGG